MPFLKRSLLKKKGNREKNTLQGKYVKREDTTQILQDRLKRFTSTPCIPTVSDSESFLNDQSSHFYSEHEIVCGHAGILMGPGDGSYQQYQESDAASAQSYFLDTNRMEAAPNLTVQSEGCPSCAMNQKSVCYHNMDKVPKMPYRNPPPYPEPSSPEQRPTTRTVSEKYRHPPPYRKPDGLVEASALRYQAQLVSSGRYKPGPERCPCTGLTRDQLMMSSGSVKSLITNSSAYSGSFVTTSEPSLGCHQTAGKQMYQTPVSQEGFAYKFSDTTSVTSEGQACGYGYYSGQANAVNSSCSDMRSDAGFGYGVYQPTPTLPSGPIPLSSGTASVIIPVGGQELPLPPEFEIAFAPDGQKYYIDHSTQTTDWVHPLEKEELPEGWEKIDSPQYGTYFINHKAEFDPLSKLHYMQHQHNSQDSDSLSQAIAPQDPVVPASPYIHAEIPEWLEVYAKASKEYDLLLKWDLFRYSELECWQTMLRRLYKREMEQIVMRYEEYSLALQQELERRQALQGRPPIKGESV